MATRYHVVEGNTQRLDGGAMFGNAPRLVWEQWITPDERHRIPLACRALLLADEHKTVLYETGVGLFFEPKLRERFGVVGGSHLLLDHLARLGLSENDIDVIVLSHLHFDHAGGLLSAYEAGVEPRLLFPRARYLVGRTAWERACAPHPRDRASFIADLPGLLERSGRLELVDRDRSPTLGEAVRFRRVDGHTPGMLLSELDTAEGPLLFVSDLAPGMSWVHVPITMGYDRHAELVVDEKRRIFSELAPQAARLFFTHDPLQPVARLVERDGRFSAEPCDL